MLYKQEGQNAQIIKVKAPTAATRPVAAAEPARMRPAPLLGDPVDLAPAAPVEPEALAPAELDADVEDVAFWQVTLEGTE